MGAAGPPVRGDDGPAGHEAAPEGAAPAGLTDALLEASPDAVIVVDAAGRIELTSAAAAGLFGYGPGELVGQEIEVLIPADVRAVHVRHRQSFMADPRARPMGAGLPLHARRRDGTTFPVDVSLVPVRFGGVPRVGAFVRDATEARRAAAVLETARLTAEHERIARDLHDTVIQHLFAIGMGLQGTQRLVEEPAAQRIDQAVEALDQVIRDIRETIFDLNRPVLADPDLRQRVREILSDAAEQLGFAPRLEIRGPVETQTTEPVLSQMLAVLREALSNVARHSRAGSARVSVQVDGGHLTLRVADDGVGLPGERPTGNGLANMAARAEQLQGEMLIGAGPEGSGTVLEWRVPLR